MAEGFEMIEALTVYDYVRRAGLKVKLVAVGSCLCSKVDIGYLLHSSGECPVGVVCPFSLEKLKDDDSPDAIVIPGGMPGAVNIAKNELALSLINKTAQSGGLVCAICAAPVVVLAKLGFLKDKVYTCYPGMQKDYAKDFLSGYKDVPVIKDGNLITARGAGAAGDFAFEIIKALLGTQIKNQIAKSVCFVL